MSMPIRSEKALRLILALIFSGAFANDATAQDDVQMYECIAQKKLAGREDGSKSAPPSKWPDGRLREMEKGDTGYRGIAKGKTVPEWIDLFATPQGHGNTFLGFYLSKDFKCVKVEG